MNLSNSSTAIKYVEDNVEEMEQHNKEHLKEFKD